MFYMNYFRTSIAISCLSLLVNTELTADTLSYSATGFAVLNAGEVPYQSEAPFRNSLAIDASVEEYREKYAKASMIYDGNSGFFDVTITALAELDGEAPYRLLVNDVLIGTVTNPETSVDYSPIRHSFTRVVIPSGATISIESLANTNGKIPEGSGTAFARGRWSMLELNNDPYEATTDNNEVDLSISVSSDKSLLYPGERVTLGVTVQNAAGSAVATGGAVVITRPSAEFGVVTLGNCTDTGNRLFCPIAELPADTSNQFQITLEALQLSPSALVSVSVSADQEDSTLDNNTLILPVSIGKEKLPVAQSATPESVEAVKISGGAISLFLLTILGFLNWLRAYAVETFERKRFHFESLFSLT